MYEYCVYTYVDDSYRYLSLIQVHIIKTGQKTFYCIYCNMYRQTLLPLLAVVTVPKMIFFSHLFSSSFS